MARMTHKERAARRHEIAYTVEAGVAPERVASEYTVSVTTVRAACQEHGIRCPRKPSIRSVNPMAVLAALLTGEDRHSVIATALGVSTQRVQQLAQDARDAGITLP